MSLTRRSLPPFAWVVVGSGTWLLGGCELEPAPGDGLVSDGREIRVEPPEVEIVLDASIDFAADCKELELFEARVLPHFTTRCVDSECHASDMRALAVLPMLMLMSEPGIACTGALTEQVVNRDAPQESLLFTSLNPADPKEQHEMVFGTAEEFAVYQQDVLTWVEAALLAP